MSGKCLGLVCVMFYLYSSQQIALVTGTTDLTNMLCRYVVSEGILQYTVYSIQCGSALIQSIHSVNYVNIVV